MHAIHAAWRVRPGSHRTSLSWRAMCAVKEEIQSEKVKLPLHRGLRLRDVVLVSSLNSLKAAEKDLLEQDVVGFDSETKPGFKTGVSDIGPHLVQFATRNRVAYLIPVKPLDESSIFNEAVRSSLSRLMTSQTLIKVGFDLIGDAKQFEGQLKIKFSNTVDLASCLEIPGRPRNLRVGTVMGASEYLGVKFPKSKSICMSNWKLPFEKMHANQILYAANDALIALEVYDAWIERNRERSSNPPYQPPQTVTTTISLSQTVVHLQTATGQPVEEEKGSACLS